MKRAVHLSDEVRTALEGRRPVVALESTIISHGFPYPANLECALASEQAIRDEGAVPATIAVLDGVPTVGLTREQIEHLACAGPGRIAKTSRRDLGVLAARGGDGATTVAGTMMLAEAVGIRVFATGGIGGVHRGAQRTFDVSADLLELARTNVCVVCAGAKSILDIGLTLEVLETHGVPVLGLATDDFPAFYSRRSGHRVDARFETPAQVAAVLTAREELGITGGVVVANPIAREHEIDADVVEGWTDSALAEAAASGIHGKEVTPFLLSRLHVLSEGVTEEANKQLVWGNSRVAARIAAEL